MANINCGNCKGQHGSAAEVKACYGFSGKFDASVNLPTPSDDELVRQARQAQKTGAQATDRQINYINSLVGERDTSVLTTGAAERLLDVGGGKPVTKAEASNLIGELRAAPMVGTKASITTEVPQGIHVKDGDYFKVQEARTTTGRLYAKRWNGRGWDYIPGGLRNLSEATVATAEQAAAFGRLYGVCCYCTRDLTDERSIAVGYGPVCAERYCLPWGHVAEGEGAMPQG